MARCAALGNQVAAIKIAAAGGQNYTLPDHLLNTL
jgi:hypothetical protein